MATHFTLGDDQGSWITVTGSTFKSIDLQPPQEIERPDKKRSTVLDNPDGEVPELVSSQKTGEDA
jgi:hypothetical protein